jgi:tRNA A-37 threonylcarbamoyl transferase component Bud32
LSSEIFSRQPEFNLNCDRDKLVRKEIEIALVIMLPTTLAWTLALPAHLYAILITAGKLQTFDLCAIGCLLFSIGVSLFLLIARRNNSMKFSRKGIIAPPIYVFTMGPRTSRSWADLKAIKFTGGSLYKTPQEMRLIFLSGGFIEFSLDTIPREELLRLLSTIRINAASAQFAPPLDTAFIAEPLPKMLLTQENFTQLWDAEMSAHYATTSFVPLETGDKLQNGRIEILDQMTVGGWSVIYRARLKDRAKMVVVKEAVIPKNASEKAKQKALELFDREAQILAGLDHPKIAKVLDHFVENEHHYEVIEFNSGMDLRRFVGERGPQPEDFVRKWGEQISEIVTYLHSQNPPVIHRDLTPDNILLQMNADLMLIDFGAANAFVSTATGTMVGKQSYMAPEQVRGKATPQSDIYSLGCILFFLLTAKDPEPLAVSHPKTISPSVTDSLDDIVAKCTAQEQELRYKNVDEVRKDLVALVKK